MSNPYNWNFPQRNETMYMSTICNSCLIKNHQRLPSIAQGSHPSKEVTFQAVNANLKYQPMSPAKILPILPSWKRFLPVMS
jgi:hypothetical protein